MISLTPKIYSRRHKRITGTTFCHEYVGALESLTTLSKAQVWASKNILKQ